ncbi:sigma 54-interacting transcriptional regulator [Bacillus sp. N1-1]|jgi:arginine utilization regulatory protein|uniref:sigma-54 interaction domain-containing protein n=1 Tax=Bacillus sp. N1-1 TaxID=2682541 RepID=UPI001315E9E9|nr:sigma 54-interacting transcriptional regulator [Bacillus sp. N1-1]QHA91907.1 PAS domain-containing protein [Bacillus sp. N1-1]
MRNTLTEGMFEAILESIDEGIHVVDNQGVTIYYNEIAAKHDGLLVEDVLGKHYLEAFPSLSKETSTLSHVLMTRKAIFNKDQTYRNMKGKLISTINTTLPIVVKGHLEGAVEIARDISRIKTLSAKVMELQSKMNKKTAKEFDDGTSYTFDHIRTNDPVFMQVKERAMKASALNSPILVYGETGTGKELIVQSIHNASKRPGPFIAQNCAALPASILESILFGTAKGSFTGAEEREGLFELANGGTLFLDEINSMPIDVQAKLLRVLEDGVIRRVGAGKTRKVDVRIIAAINEEPELALEDRRLRVDLFYRLNVIYLRIPPLRERRGDIPDLIAHFIEKYNTKFQKHIVSIDEKAEFRLYHRSWQGNVRELEHVIQSAMNFAEGDVLVEKDFPMLLSEPMREMGQSLPEILLKTEADLIQRAMKNCLGNVKKAAEQLGIPRQTLQYKLSKHQSQSAE